MAWPSPLIFGIAVSTLLTLVVIPVLFFAVSQRRLSSPVPSPQPLESHHDR